MDSEHPKQKDLVVGSDGGLESSTMDICDRSLDDIYFTANSDMLIENLLKQQPELKNLKERDERPTTGSEKNSDEDGVLQQRIRQFHIGISTLKEDNETPQDMRLDESGQRVNSQEHIDSSRTTADTDLESQIDSKLMQMESSEGIDVFQKENINIDEELQDEIRKYQKLQMAIEDLQKKLVTSEEENKALKTELQRSVQNNDGVKKVVCDMEINGACGGVSTLETDKMKCKSSEQGQSPMVGTQNDRNVQKECNNVQEELLLQERKSSLRTEASCELQGMRSSRDGTSNLLMEIEDPRKENSGQFDSMQDQITLLLQEVKAKTELVDIQQKQIGDLLQALVKSNSAHNRCMEEQGDVNNLQVELEHAQEENQKLQKELSTRLTDLKNLHIMFSTFGREKEIMAAELALKDRLLGDMEEHLNDLKEQNKTLSNKLEAYARENKIKNRDTQETIASLQNRNKLLARTEASCELQGMRSSRDGTSNLLMEIEDPQKENSGQFDSMQDQITLLLQEVKAKTELVDIQQKQIGDLLQALVKSNSEHNRCMEEQGDVNNLQVELEHAQEENQKLQKELSTRLTDLKNLHIMFSTFGREKEIMAAELALKDRLLGDMEEHLNDLKEQNKTLSNKLEAYARENKIKNRDTQETIASLQNRNKLLAEQVLRTSEGYRAFKRKSKELREQNSGFKREIANLKTSILKQEKFSRVLETERAALLNEISWGNQQLHILLKNCECFQQENESLTEQQLTKPDRQKSLKEEFVLLEKLLLRLKEEIACLKADPNRGVEEHKKLKEEMAVLQNELLFLRTENSLLIQEKKLDADRDGSIKGLEDVVYMPSSKGEILQAEMADINMEKNKLKHDDPTDLRAKQSTGLYITQNQDDEVSSLNMPTRSEGRPP